MHVYLRLILLPLFAFNVLLAKTPTQAITTIATYAHDGMMLPVLNDYEDVGIINIGTHNIESINEKIKGLNSSELDTKIEIQAIVDEYNTMIKVKSYSLQIFPSQLQLLL